MGRRLAEHALRAAVGVATLAAAGAPSSTAAVTVACTEAALRAAITAANAGTGDTTMVLPGPCTVTLSGPTAEDGNVSGDLDITASMSVQGAGAGVTVIEGTGADRVVDVLAGTLSLSGVTIRNGVVDGMAVGGGIRNVGVLALTDAAVHGNTSAFFGGGIHNTGTLILTRTTVDGNAAVVGAGIANSSGTMTLTDSLVRGNTATDNGGGIWTTGGTAHFTNVTISGNRTNLNGGGIFQTGSGILTIVNGTIVENGAQNVASGFFGSATMQNTIVAANGDGNCAGAITSLGHNLEDTDTCGFSGPGDFVNATPRLGPLQDNGGSLPTHALLPGSPAIDAGANDACPAADARGVSRPLDAVTAGIAVCDIGAVEVETLGFIQMALTLGATTVQPGTPLHGSVIFANPGGARVVDVYLALAFPPASGPGLGCPAGDAILFLTSTGGTLTCVANGVATFAPLMTGVGVPGGVSVPLTAPVLALSWPPGAPTGQWIVALVLTPRDAFRDGRAEPLAGIAVATAAFHAAAPAATLDETRERPSGP